ncbi:MAG: DUF1801 domain-containing protein [Planctomycetota bacterium]|nr:MAG: DUF1801 domain-containing protein [Planctomycetota bacterium]
MQSKATSVQQYLSELPADRRAIIEAVRKLILDNLDDDFEEGMQYGMIGYYVPHRVFPAGYHCDPRQPLPFAALASQKNYLSLYLMPSYGEGQQERSFRQKWAKTGKKLDMGKCCIRFKKLEDLALDVIADAIRGVTPAEYIRSYQAAVPAARAGAARPGAGAPKRAATRSARAAKAPLPARARKQRSRKAR